MVPADAVATSMEQIDRRLVLVGLSGSDLLSAGEAGGVAVAVEGFADLVYNGAAQPMPRDPEGVLIRDESTVVSRAHSLIHDVTIPGIDGMLLHFRIDTLPLQEHSVLPTTGACVANNVLW